jgi:pantoate--beta-alanine ligase
MKIAETPQAMRDLAEELRRQGKSIGFAPTMGALHEGHISLIHAACAENDVVAASIFVNPTQFGPNEDYSRYPRTFGADCSLLETAGCDILYYPEASVMYPGDYETWVSLEKLPDHLCGLFRPGHFRGVATVVLKLFQAVMPHRAYFGQKDYQQAVVIRRMVRDLNLFTDVRVCPIVREKDGLAKSSRNRYLSPVEREQALVLYRTIRLAIDRITRGERNAEKLLEEMRHFISRGVPDAKIDYVSIVHPDSLEDVPVAEDGSVIALALWIGNTRLIDNHILGADFPYGEEK